MRLPSLSRRRCRCHTAAFPVAVHGWAASGRARIGARLRRGAVDRPGNMGRRGSGHGWRPSGRMQAWWTSAQRFHDDRYKEIQDEYNREPDALCRTRVLRGSGCWQALGMACRDAGVGSCPGGMAWGEPGPGRSAAGCGRPDACTTRCHPAGCHRHRQGLRGRAREHADGHVRGGTGRAVAPSGAERG